MSTISTACTRCFRAVAFGASLTGEPAYTPARIPIWLRLFLSLAVIAWLTIVLLVFAARLTRPNFRVDGVSMEPTIHSGDLVLVNRMGYDFSSPRRGDIIVFKLPAGNFDSVERVIGLPGDIVQVRANRGVCIDGRRLREPYVATPAAYSFGPHRIPPHDYFVLGDNRNASYDSHIWGFLRRQDIIGNLVVDYWPPSHLSGF